jgi:hypothetical protein
MEKYSEGTKKGNYSFEGQKADPATKLPLGELEENRRKGEREGKRKMLSQLFLCPHIFLSEKMKTDFTC